MSPITFERTAEDRERVVVDGEHVGDLLRHPDILAHVVVPLPVADLRTARGLGEGAARAAFDRTRQAARNAQIGT